MLEHIPVGSENGTTIARIAEAAGISPRKVRSEINRLRREGRHLVVTLPKTNGVYLARSPEEYDARDRPHQQPGRCSAHAEAGHAAGV